jgi:hypothetical protein
MKQKDASDARLGIGLAIGAGIGLAIGTILGNIALWMPIGAALGLIFGGGLILQDKSRKNVAK